MIKKMVSLLVLGMLFVSLSSESLLAANNRDSKRDDRGYINSYKKSDGKNKKEKKVKGSKRGAKAISARVGDNRFVLAANNSWSSSNPGWDSDDAQKDYQDDSENKWRESDAGYSEENHEESSDKSDQYDSSDSSGSYSEDSDTHEESTSEESEPETADSSEDEWGENSGDLDSGMSEDETNDATEVSEDANAAHDDHSDAPVVDDKQPTTVVVDNLIPNYGFESSLDNSGALAPAGWLTGNWGNNKSTFKYPIPGYEGDKAVEITMESWTDGDAKWFFQDVAVSPGQSYEFSDYYKSNTKSSLTVRYTHTDGTYSYAVLGSEVAPSSEWKQAKGTFTVPAGVSKLSVFHTILSTGSISIDSTSLRLSTGAEKPSADPAITGRAFEKGMVSLSFDDNWNSQSVVLPMLADAGIKGSFYVVTSDLADDQFNLVQIQDIFNAGHEVSAHTRSHPFLNQIAPEKAFVEIEGSRQDLMKADILPASTFAYPYGEYNDAVINATKDAGFKGARGVQEGYNTKDVNKYALLVQNVRNTTTPEEMKKWIKTAMDTNTWLILVFHQVDNKNEPYGISPENFKALVDHLKENKIPTVTVEQGLQMME